MPKGLSSLWVDATTAEMPFGRAALAVVGADELAA